MAFIGNSIYPATYQPTYAPQYIPQYQQPQFQPQSLVTQQTAQQMQTQPPVMQQNSIVWINDEKDALSYPIAPNNAVALWEVSGKRIYVKSADATGKPTIKTYDLVEHVDAEIVDNPKETPFASKDDLSVVVTSIKELSSVVSNIKAELSAVQSDLYGLQGKRKTTRKQDADVDE